MTDTATTSLGTTGEQLAADYLTDQGMVVLDRNWRTRTGEVDIILRDKDALVFCEVKTRLGEGFGNPFEAVAAAKQRRLRKLATEWLLRAGVRPSEVRFDVVSVLPLARGAERLVHLRGAF